LIAPTTHSGKIGLSRKRGSKPSSCHQHEARSFSTGPWSVDWLQDNQREVKGLISSKNKRLKKVEKEISRGGGSFENKVAKRKKAGGVLRHPLLTLKKVARLPIKDREEVMKVLRKSKIMKALKHKIRNRRRLRAKITRSLEDVEHHSFNESSS
jgi:hypothetical protein